MIVALGLAVLLLGGLPILLMTLPDPVPVKKTSLEGERVGTFVEAEAGLFKLFPYTAPNPAFPPSAAVTGPQPKVFVRARRLDALSAYTIRPYPGGEPLPVDRRLLDPQTLELACGRPLPSGKYYVTAARDGMYGGTDYFYFRVGPL